MGPRPSVIGRCPMGPFVARGRRVSGSEVLTATLLAVDDRRVGDTVRLIRRELRSRQVDVAATAGVSQSTVSDIELGRFGSMDVSTIRSVVRALGAELVIDVRWRGADLARLRDRDHAAIVEQIVAILRRSGWEVLVEWSFNHFGERGSIDIVGWHPRYRSLLVVEVKSRLVDLQDLLSTLDRKVRLAPGLLRIERGWRPEAVGRLVVVRESGFARSVASVHGSIFEAALPDRSRRCRGWIQEPRGPLRGLWFLSGTAVGGARRNSSGDRRVRRPLARGR